MRRRKRSVAPKTEPIEVNYPAEGSGPQRRRDGGAVCDHSRRDFLRRIGLTAGGASILTAASLPRLAHGQSFEVNFDLLASHPPTAPAALEQPVAGLQAAGSGGALAERSVTSDTAAEEPVAATPDGQTDGQTDGQIASNPDAPLEDVVENRALWIEPGYLALVRWSRPAENEDVVAALEGSADAMGAYLTENVLETNDIHDLDRLHQHERALLELLAPVVAPAIIEVIHLDHDCTTVCSLLGPSIGPGELDVVLGGAMASPEW